MNAWLDWTDGIIPVNASIASKGSKTTRMPAIFGGNFQYVSFAQKAVKYNNDSSISAGILQVMNFVGSSETDCRQTQSQGLLFGRPDSLEARADRRLLTHFTGKSERFRRKEKKAEKSCLIAMSVRLC